jgi:hypothetical protein
MFLACLTVKFLANGIRDVFLPEVFLQEIDMERTGNSHLVTGKED